MTFGIRARLKSSNDRGEFVLEETILLSFSIPFNLVGGILFATRRYDIGTKFVLDRARIKNNIAENSVALGHETHNTLQLLVQHIQLRAAT